MAYDQKKVKAQILELLPEVKLPRIACAQLGISRPTYYKWRKQDPDFREATDMASAECSYELEETAYKRAIEGSDTLLIFLLRAYNPDKFKERKEINHVHESIEKLRSMSPEEIHVELDRLRAEGGRVPVAESSATKH